MDDISYLAYNILCPLEENCGTPMVFQNTFSYVGSMLTRCPTRDRLTRCPTRDRLLSWDSIPTPIALCVMHARVTYTSIVHSLGRFRG